MRCAKNNILHVEKLEQRLALSGSEPSLPVAMWVEGDTFDTQDYNQLVEYATRAEPLQTEKLILRLADPDSPDPAIRSNFGLTASAGLIKALLDLDSKRFQGEIALIPDFTSNDHKWQWQPDGVQFTAEWQKAFYWAKQANDILVSHHSHTFITEINIEAQSSGVPATAETLQAIRTYQHSIWPELDGSSHFVGTGFTHGYTNLSQLATWTQGSTAGQRLLDAGYAQLYNMTETVGGVTYVDAYAAGASVTNPVPKAPTTIYTASCNAADPVEEIFGTPTADVEKAASTFGFFVGKHTTDMPPDLSRTYLMFSMEDASLQKGLIDAFGTWDADVSAPGAGVDDFIELTKKFTDVSDSEGFMHFWNATSSPNICTFQYEFLPASWKSQSLQAVESGPTLEDLVLWDYRKVDVKSETALVDYHAKLLSYLKTNQPQRLILYVTDPAIAGNSFYDPTATQSFISGVPQNFLSFLIQAQSQSRSAGTTLPIEILLSRGSFDSDQTVPATWVPEQMSPPSEIHLPFDWRNLPRAFSWLTTLLHNPELPSGLIHRLTLDPELEVPEVTTSTTENFTDTNIIKVIAPENVVIGQTLSASGSAIPSNTLVLNKNNAQITLSHAVTVLKNDELQFRSAPLIRTTTQAVSATDSIPVNDTSGLAKGMTVLGPEIPLGIIVTSVSQGWIQLSSPVTLQANESLVFERLKGNAAYQHMICWLDWAKNQSDSTKTLGIGMAFEVDSHTFVKTNTLTFPAILSPTSGLPDLKSSMLVTFLNTDQEDAVYPSWRSSFDTQPLLSMAYMEAYVGGAPEAYSYFRWMNTLSGTSGKWQVNQQTPVDAANGFQKSLINLPYAQGAGTITVDVPQPPDGEATALGNGSNFDTLVQYSSIETPGALESLWKIEKIVGVPPNPNQLELKGQGSSVQQSTWKFNEIPMDWQYPRIQPGQENRITFMFSAEHDANGGLPFFGYWSKQEFLDFFGQAQKQLADASDPSAAIYRIDDSSGSGRGVPAKNFAIYDLEQLSGAWNVGPFSSFIIRPQLRRSTTIDFRSTYGPTPLRLTHADLSTSLVRSEARHDNTRDILFIVTGIASGYVEKRIGNEWVNISRPPPRSSSPKVLLEFFEQRLIKQTDEIRWIPPSGVGHTVTAFSIRGWDGLGVSLSDSLLNVEL